MELRKIDENNIWNIIKLCVDDEQSNFVATNTQSLLEAYVTVTSGKVALPFGLYEENTLVGFVMFGYGSSGEEGEPLVAANNYCIWRFMIDKVFQGKGLGKKGMQAALDYLKSVPETKSESVWLSYEKENIVAKALYNSLG